jgi:hypothetical protein
VFLRDFRSHRAALLTFIALNVALLPIMVLASFDFGVTWDEEDRHNYGVRVWEFLRGLRPRSAFRETGGHVYPGLFDTICAAAEGWLPWTRFETRHVINATFGWIGVVYCGRLAARLFGPWAGVLASALLALSPRYFAASMNNPKDLPFAAMSVTALYYISTVSPRWPYIPAWTAVKITIALALALGIRVGGLLYLGYFGLLLIALVILDRQTHLPRLLNVVARVALISVAVLLLGTICWPWAGGAPFTRPFEALLGAAGYPWNGLVLFAGVAYPAQELPRWYAPWFFLISRPPVVLAGALASLVFIASRDDALRRGGLWGVVIFPVAVAIILRSTLYDGVRHLLFIYPVVVVLAAGGWAGLLQPARVTWVRYGAAAAVAVGIVSMLVFDIRFHPNQGVYFNSLVGGPRGAFKRYEMDYWGNCIFQAVEWVAGRARNMGTPLIVTGYPPHLVMLDAQRFPELNFNHKAEGNYHVYINTARGPVKAFRDIAGEPSLHRISTPDGAVLCNIEPGPALRNRPAVPR